MVIRGRALETLTGSPPLQITKKKRKRVFHPWWAQVSLGTHLNFRWTNRGTTPEAQNLWWPTRRTTPKDKEVRGTTGWTSPGWTTVQGTTGWTSPHKMTVKCSLSKGLAATQKRPGCRFSCSGSRGSGIPGGRHRSSSTLSEEAGSGGAGTAGAWALNYHKSEVKSSNSKYWFDLILHFLNW